MASAMIEAKAIGQASAAKRSEAGPQTMTTAGIPYRAAIIGPTPYAPTVALAVRPLDPAPLVSPARPADGLLSIRENHLSRETSAKR